MNDPIHPHHFAHSSLTNTPHLFSNAPAPPTLSSQPDLGSIDFSQFDDTLDGSTDLTNPFDTTPQQFDPRNQARFHEIQSPRQLNGFQQNQEAGQFVHPQRLPARQQNEAPKNAGQFGVLTPHPQLPSQPQSQEASRHFQTGGDPRSKTAGEGGTTDGHFGNMRMIPNPPDLEAWRAKLFNIDDTVVMTEEQFRTYFPHVDNIYSHRSTQKYKRKPFVSHYWDCRLKGRPPGTAKSDDPNKQKRKRQARERDLCDVKIKITEYFPGARLPEHDGTTAIASQVRQTAPGNADPNLASASALGADDSSKGHNVPVSSTERYYTIQRVNGNGANGKDMAPTGGHRHTIADSDKIKKNSIYRFFLKEQKERRKTQKTYHKKVSGAALNTVKKRSKEHDLKLFGSCFCPFVQRVWISLEMKGLSYQYIEIDPYEKPDQLLAINPRGLVPALKHGDWGCYESSVLMEYLEDLNTGYPLLPQADAKSRARCRLWSDHINRKILPKFYAVLQAQETEKQAEHAGELRAEITTLVNAADPTGPFFLGPHPSFVDVQFAPWVIRLRRVLKPYRAWPDPEPGSRWARWVDAIEGNESVKATTSTDELYIDSYERYAENRPNTSQVAKAINEGGGLP